MIDDVATFLSNNLGTVSGWTLVVLALLGWWKGIPSFIDAWEKRAGGIEVRLQASMAATLERYDRELARCGDQLKEAERHHKICIDEQEVLRIRISEQDKIIATQNSTIATQTQTIVEMADQMKGLQISNIQQQTDLAGRIKDFKI